MSEVNLTTEQQLLVIKARFEDLRRLAVRS